MPHPARRQLKKGQTPPAIGLKADCGCQGSLIVVIPTVVADFGYFPASHRILSYRDNCYTV